MPLVAIPVKARDLAVEARKKARLEQDEGNYGGRATAYEHGVFDALRTMLPSDVIGMIIMDADCAADGEEMFTDGLPKLVTR